MPAGILRFLPSNLFVEAGIVFTRPFVGVKVCPVLAGPGVLERKNHARAANVTGPLARVIFPARSSTEPQAEGRMRAKYFKPGDGVPDSGIYTVHHDSHRLMHASTLLGGGKFPSCRKCGDAVRFKLLRIVRDRQVLPFRSNAILEEYQPRPRIVGKG